MTGFAGAAGILLQLEQAGYRAYAVGGCVRDLLLHRPVHDWDVATSARPEQVMAVFARCVPTGLRHGTVTVLEHGTSYEVTTFRSDGAYTDGRHPDGVRFVGDLESDLQRRDFTVNAMAMDAAGNLTDRHGGRRDLHDGLIRCVGDPRQRFSEDALRMLRAVRFSAQLGFRVEEETERAMAACAPLCAKLSAERVRDEMEKTLLSPRPAALMQMLELGMLRPFGLEAPSSMAVVEAADCERLARWTALKLALPGLDFARLRLDRRTAEICSAAAALFQPELTMDALKRLVSRHGWEIAACVCRVNGQTALLEELQGSGQCVTRGQLAVNGKDFPWVSGPAVGQLLNWLLEYVLEHPEANTRTQLLQLAERWRFRR